jgi:hypothetical protein
MLILLDKGVGSISEYLIGSFGCFTLLYIVHMYYSAFGIWYLRMYVHGRYVLTREVGYQPPAKVLVIVPAESNTY